MATAISIKNVTKTFGSKHALDNVSLNIPQGHIYGFLGPNGAGKTTLIRCLMDYIASDGVITILGRNAHSESAELKRSVGYLSSDMQLHPNWTTKIHIDFMASIKGRGQADELIKTLNLDMKAKVRNLSSGNKQKLAIILAFLGSPKLLIMDEPTRGLDPLLQNQLYELLRRFAKAGGTVFLSSHNLGEVQHLCDNVAVIREGKIVAAEAMKDILQMRVHMVEATATTAFVAADLKLKDIEILSSAGKSVTLKARGKIDPIIKALAKYDLVDVEVSHPNLEDVFMEYY
ncbi:MAG TPA: ABC transporter ATP-binding protein [Candidatus Polarisedimenticolaceae bacterium]|nr:ABC transporter ATP-binding protein [Candidatus Polarisedimenticolaceae bacterium]